MGDWLKQIGKHAIDPTIAVMFWILVALLVLLWTTTAVAKGDSFASIGTFIMTSIGVFVQAYLAYAVFRLGSRQFDFSKLSSDLAHRREVYNIRSDILNRFKSEVDWFTNGYVVSHERTQIFQNLYLEINRTFPNEVSDAAFDFYQRTLALSVKCDQAQRGDKDGNYPAYRLLKELQHDAQELLDWGTQVADDMHNEMGLQMKGSVD
jgi:hypothetical protein